MYLPLCQSHKSYMRIEYFGSKKFSPYKKQRNQVAGSELKETPKPIFHISYNLGHNILALFNNLAQVRIATSKTILDI